jgi:hypothetical protein
MLMKLLLSLLCLVGTAAAAERQWDAEILPSEREVVTDAESGARLIFVTSHESEDTNLYFHQWSWLPDSSLMLFRSARDGRTGLFGYVEASGELARLEEAGQPRLMGDVTASRHGNSLYVMREGQVLEWQVAVAPGAQGAPARVTLTERRVAALPDLPGNVTGLNENSDGSMLVFGFNDRDTSHIVWMDRQTGEVRHLAKFAGPIQHVQASWDTPGLAMFATGALEPATGVTRDRLQHRMWLVDAEDGRPRMLYPQLEGELVTHEQFWVKDQVVFCSGMGHEGDAQESHVKVVDVRTGIARIICAGSWWPGGEAAAVAKLNWWHCSGAPNGRYVAADNWHGDIAIASALTARHRILTSGHRTYGSGAHPHVGWDPTGYRVVFATNLRGNADVCIAELPEDWRGEW